MRILNLSLDPSVTNPSSQAAGRLIKYGQVIEKYVVIVPADSNQEIQLSPQVQVIGLKRSRLRWLTWLGFFRRVNFFLRSNQFDVISVQDPYFLGLLAIILKKFFPIGVEIQVHGFEKKTFLRRTVARFVLRRAEAVRTVSQRLKKELMSEFAVAENLITVVSVWVPELPPINRSYLDDQAVAGKKFIFLTVGRLVPVKNIFLQLKALEIVLREISLVELWVVGDGPERSALINFAKKIGLGDKVKWWGWQKSALDYYRQANALILSSFSEGWPLVIIEAAQCGLPIIMTDVGSAGEFIKDDENGLIIPVNNHQELAKSMLRLIKEPALANRLSRSLFEAATRRLSLEATLSLYKQSWTIASHNYH